VIPVKTKKPGLFFFLLALILALLASFLAVAAVNSFNRQTTVYVPTKEIAPYTKITPDLVTQTSVPAASIIGTRINDLSEMNGKYTNTAIHMQTPITKELLTSSPGGDLTAELSSQKRLDVRALPIPVTPVTGFGGKLAVGDRIDFIATTDAVTNQGNTMMTSTVAQNIPVLSRVEDGGKLVGVVVEVTAQQAQDISHYMETGKLKFSLQPQPSNQEVDLQPTVSKGFIVNNPNQKGGVN
jgi:Flp pilus assembly protein CpaB